MNLLTGTDLIHDVLSLFIQDIDNAINLAMPYVNDLLFALLGIEIIFFGYEIAFGKSASLGVIIERIIMMGGIVLIVRNFPYYTMIFSNSLSKILSLSIPSATADYVQSPGMIISWGQDVIVNNYNNAVSNVLSHAGFFGKALAAIDLNPTIFVLSIKEAIIGLGFEISFIILAVQMALAQIEFHLMILFAMILLPFIAWAPLRFLGMRAFGAVIGQAIKVGIITFVVTLGVNIINTLAASAFNTGVFQPTTANIVSGNVLALLAASMLLVFLAWQAPSLAMSLLSGSPAFNAATFGQNMGLGLVMGSIAGGFRGLMRGGSSGGSAESSQATPPQQQQASSSSTGRTGVPASAPSATSQYQPTQITASPAPATEPAYARAPGYSGNTPASARTLAAPSSGAAPSRAPAAAALQPQYIRRT